MPSRRDFLSIALRGSAATMVTGAVPAWLPRYREGAFSGRFFQPVGAPQAGATRLGTVAFDVKATAQSLFNVVIVGVGIIVGSKIATGAAQWVTDETTGALDYQKLFSIPMWAGVACLVLLLVFYRGGRRAPDAGPA